jgi:hypothetical protein
MNAFFAPLLAAMAIVLALPAASQQAMVPVAAVSAVANGSISEPYRRFRASLVEVDGGVDLYIHLEADGEMQLAAHARGVAWRGGMAGQQPELEIAENDSLRLVSQNESIGRDRWRQVLTIAFRDGRFVVAGFTHASRDTLDPDSAGECDVNLLTGRGIRDGRKFRTDLRALPVEDWTMDTLPGQCFE